MEIQKINSYLSTLVFVLMVVGYQFFTTIFLPVNSDIDDLSQRVTIPYRAFTLLVYLMILILNFKYKVDEISFTFKLFLFFWIILVVRIFYDTILRVDVDLNDTQQLWLYILGIIIPLLLVLIKSYKYIDFQKSLWIVFSMSAIVLVITLFTNQTMFVGDIDDGRQDANIALNTITFGHLGVTVALLSIYIFFKKQTTLALKMLIILIGILGIYSMLRAGSRGPFIAFLGVLFMWYISNKKNFVRVVFVIVVSAIILFVFIDQFLEVVGYFSPLMEERLHATIYEGDTNERNPLYEAAINHFLDSPIFGKQFAIFEQVRLYEGNGSFIYSHNIILDAFMGLGLIGGLILIYVLLSLVIMLYKNLKYRIEDYWISLIMTQVLISIMLSGAIYYDPLFSGLLALHFLKYHKFDYQKSIEA